MAGLVSAVRPGVGFKKHSGSSIPTDFIMPSFSGISSSIKHRITYITAEETIALFAFRLSLETAEVPSKLIRNWSSVFVIWTWIVLPLSIRSEKRYSPSASRCSDNRALRSAASCTDFIWLRTKASVCSATNSNSADSPTLFAAICARMSAKFSCGIRLGNSPDVSSCSSSSKRDLPPTTILKF